MNESQISGIDLDRFEIKCPLCGYAFNPSNCVVKCSKCNFVKKCDLLRCPNCGYSFPSEKTYLGKLLNGIVQRIKGITW
ncbi:MAG: hypothetical protein ACXAC8_04905 [Candidatus Hodarchaeales archaeon]|jgi:uncharacterized Zn finger protein